MSEQRMETHPSILRLFTPVGKGKQQSKQTCRRWSNCFFSSQTSSATWPTTWDSRQYIMLRKKDLKRLFGCCWLKEPFWEPEWIGRLRKTGSTSGCPDCSTRSILWRTERAGTLRKLNSSKRFITSLQASRQI